MGIVTKKGDRGRTSLYRGKPVNKDDIRLEACGTIDELSSYLGLAKCLAKSAKVRGIIESVQRDLFILSTEIVTDVRSRGGVTPPLLKKKIYSSHINRLDKVILDLEKKNGLKLGCFQLPGAGRVSAVLDISRSIARRAERRAVTLSRKKLLNNEHILAYLNRLSDLLYLLARLPEDFLGA